ncbi:MAG: GntR family transcriptional regulator [Gammaproteobacteria bacterium]|nr:GntR family transcriptional regulator [Gammaproteobacteria bacterium]
MNKELLYTDLKKQILTLVLEPGSALDEQSLSEKYEISRTPLREVLRKLAGEGYVDIVSNRGASVSSMNHKVLRDFFVTAPMLYAAVGRLAAENARPQQIESMKTAQQRFHEASQNSDAGEMVYWNDQFHSLMGDMADNPYLTPSYNRLLIDHARISQTFYRPRNKDMAGRVDMAVRHHDKMIEAIESGDSERMVELIIEHWELSQELMDYFVRPDPLPITDIVSQT